MVMLYLRPRLNARIILEKMESLLVMDLIQILVNILSVMVIWFSRLRLITIMVEIMLRIVLLMQVRLDSIEVILEKMESLLVKDLIKIAKILFEPTMIMVAIMLRIVLLQVRLDFIVDDFLSILVRTLCSLCSLCSSLENTTQAWRLAANFDIFKLKDLIKFLANIICTMAVEVLLRSSLLSQLGLHFIEEVDEFLSMLTRIACSLLMSYLKPGLNTKYILGAMLS